MKKIRWFITACFIFMWLIGSTAWASLAIYYGDSNSSTLQLIISGVVAFIGLVTIMIFLFVSSWRNRLLSFHSIVFLMILLWWFNIQPSNTRDWQRDVNKLAYADVDGDLVTVHNIRNFSYQSEFDYTPEYYEKTYDLQKLEGLDLFAVYWMGPAIAHIIMSFDFGDQHLAVSIEARKEEGEAYSTIKGFFRQYELIYIVADERDLIGLRTHYRNNPPEQVYRYRLKSTKVKKQGIKRLFMEYIKNINALHKAPAFYNTLLTNCTSVIWLNSRVNPGHLPFSWKILMSGYVPEYLYESGRLDQSLSLSDLKDKAYVNPLVEKQAISSSFSSTIRR